MSSTTDKEALDKLAELSKEVYLEQSLYLMQGQPVPNVLKELIELHHAELAQYAAIKALNFDSRLRDAARQALNIVASAVIQSAIATAKNYK